MPPLPAPPLRTNLGTWAVPDADLPAVAAVLLDALPPEPFDPAFRGQELEMELGVRVYVRRLDGRISGLFAYDDGLGACMLLNANHPRDRRTQDYITGRFG